MSPRALRPRCALVIKSHAGACLLFWHLSYLIMRVPSTSITTYSVPHSLRPGIRRLHQNGPTWHVVTGSNYRLAIRYVKRRYAIQELQSNSQNSVQVLVFKAAPDGQLGPLSPSSPSESGTPAAASQVRREKCKGEIHGDMASGICIQFRSIVEDSYEESRKPSDGKQSDEHDPASVMAALIKASAHDHNGAPLPPHLISLCL